MYKYSLTLIAHSLQFSRPQGHHLLLIYALNREFFQPTPSLTSFLSFEEPLADACWGQDQSY